MAGFVLFVSGLSVLLLMTFDGLGSSVGHIFEHLGHGIGGVLTIFCVAG